MYHLCQVPYKQKFQFIRKVNIRAYAIGRNLCVILYVNGHIHVDFLHKHERMN